MRILHLYKTYYPVTTGGCEQVIKTLTHYTAKLGCQNKLLTLSPEAGYVRTDSLEVVYLPINIEVSSCPINLKLLWQFKHYAKDADIIHCHFPWPFADLIYLLSKIKKPTIVTYQSDVVRQRFLKKFYTPVMKKFLSRVDKIVLTSDNYLNSSVDIAPYKDKCKVIPLGICPQDYPPASEDLKKQWLQRVGKNFILFVGVLRAYKGLDYLIEAVSGTNIPLVLIGTGKEEKRLKEKSANDPNIIFLGKVSEQDKVALIELCKAVVLPSHLRSEAFGICLLEGLLLGKPLISTDLNTGTSFVNQHNVTGLVVPPNNPTELRAAIRKLYDNAQLAKQMGVRAKEHYLKNFQAQSMAQNYFELYNSLLS